MNFIFYSLRGKSVYQNLKGLYRNRQCKTIYFAQQSNLRPSICNEND